MTSSSDPDIRVDSRQLRKLKLSDFHSAGPLETQTDNSQIIPDPNLTSGTTAAQLRSARDRLAEGIPPGGNRLCYPVDRAAALAVYREALSRVNSKNHEQIQCEANVKVETVLGIRQAKAEDVVFTTGGMLLSPLEPQYAEPRINSVDDPYGHKAAWRLKAWRRDGWPRLYPGIAIRDERKTGWGKKEDDGGHVELFKKMESWDEGDWGDQVDADMRH